MKQPMVPVFADVYVHCRARYESKAQMYESMKMRCRRSKIEELTQRKSLLWSRLYPLLPCERVRDARRQSHSNECARSLWRSGLWQEVCEVGYPWAK